MIELLNVDCMEYMETIPDQFFDLAVVDPPYGINVGTFVGGVNRSVKVGGGKLSNPKFTGGLMTVRSLKKSFLLN